MLFPLPPNWRVPIQVTPAFRTDVNTSQSGREQRRALRTTPRLSLVFTVTVSGDERRQLIALLRQHQNETMTLADPTRTYRYCHCCAAPDWFVAGRPIVINNAVIGFAGTTRLRDGDVVHPALTGRISGTVSASHPVSRAAEGSITFAVEPGSEPDLSGEPQMFVHAGREVFETKPNWSEDVGFDHEWPVEQLDYGQGRVGNYAFISEGWATQTATFLGCDPQAVTEIERFFGRMRGRRGEFFMPTGTDDITMAASVVTGGTTLPVVGAPAALHGAIAIRLLDDRLLLRTVTGVQAGVLKLVEPWLFDVHPSDVAMISWMPVSRFASDEMTVEWPTDQVAQAQLAMRSLPALPPEKPTTIYDGAARWVLESWGKAAPGLLERVDYLINGVYPATFFLPLAWVRVNEAALCKFDRQINITYPETFGVRGT